MTFRTTFVAFFTLAAACTESHPDEPDAAIIIPDTGPRPDTGTDAGPPPGNTGEACELDEDCTGPAETCITEAQSGLPGGYCSGFCETDEDCASDAVCVQLDDTTAICLRSCDPTAEDQCRTGYGCASGLGIPNICYPGCEDASDCGEGQMCEVGGGFNGSGACFDPSAGVGDACEDSGDCPAGGVCNPDDAGWPGGACLTFGCDEASGTGCPGDAECLPGGFGGALCVDGCASDTDCRDGYECIPSLRYPDRLSCQPAFDAGNLGAACGRRGGCTGGTCLNEAEYGFPQGYCAAVGCDPDAEDPGCPGDGVCIEATSGTGVCLDGCASDTDCRIEQGYACRPSVTSDPESARACRPACASDDQCSMRLGYECNQGLGLCRPPVDPSELGEPCGEATVCAGGLCMSEDEEGWPSDGMCTLPGCRISGEGSSEPCPTGTVCVDDGGGDPTLGICVTACTVGGTDCRAGYTCRASVEGGTEGSCAPACAAETCAGTCNVETGLCGA
jgi:hypothetical protein